MFESAWYWLSLWLAHNSPEKHLLSTTGYNQGRYWCYRFIFHTQPSRIFGAKLLSSQCFLTHLDLSLVLCSPPYVISGLCGFRRNINVKSEMKPDFTTHTRNTILRYVAFPFYTGIIIPNICYEQLTSTVKINTNFRTIQNCIPCSVCRPQNVVWGINYCPN